jgi:hypothetical protein
VFDLNHSPRHDLICLLLSPAIEENDWPCQHGDAVHIVDYLIYHRVLDRLIDDETSSSDEGEKDETLSVVRKETEVKSNLLSKIISDRSCRDIKEMSPFLLKSFEMTCKEQFAHPFRFIF